MKTINHTELRKVKFRLLVPCTRLVIKSKCVCSNNSKIEMALKKMVYDLKLDNNILTILFLTTCFNHLHLASEAG